MQMIRGFHWYEYPINCLYYFLMSAVDHAIIFALGCLVLVLVSLWARVGYLRLLKRWSIFNIILILVGAAMSGFWDCLIYGHLYVTADYVADFSLIFPITQNTIDVHFDDYSGHLIGVSLRQLQCVWLLFALVTWTLAAVIYFRGAWIWWRVKHLTRRSSQPLTGATI
jgi:hypothetical protein